MKNILLIAFLILSLFTSCDDRPNEQIVPEPEPPKEYVVYFTNGEDVNSVTLISGQTVEPIDVEDMDRYTFSGWFEGDSLFDFSTKIFKDTYLEARWEKKLSGPITITVNLDNEPYNNIEVVLKGTEDFSGVTEDGVFFVPDALGGEYSVTLNDYGYGSFKLESENGVNYIADYFTLSSEAGEGVSSTFDDIVLPKGQSTGIAATIENGYEFTGWYKNEELLVSEKDTEYVLNETTTLAAKAELKEFSLSIKDDEGNGGGIHPSTYFMDKETEQWCFIENPSRSGYTVTEYEIIQDSNDIRSYIDGNFLKIRPGAWGDIVVEPTWEQNGESVSVAIRKDGIPWNSGKSISLQTTEGTYSGSEATITDGNYVWESIGYGQVQLLIDGKETGFVANITEGNPVDFVLDYWTLSVEKSEGIESITGEGIYLNGETAHLVASVKDGWLFSSWSDTDTLGNQIELDVSVTETKTIKANTEEEVIGEKSLLNGRIFYIQDMNNGAVYHFYDADLNEIKAPWTTESLKDAKYYALSGNPTSPRFWISLETSLPEQTYTWGKYGVSSGGKNDGIGEGENNTALALEKSVEEGSIWESLPEGYFIGSKAEYDILMEVLPWAESLNIWSSVESNKYSAWLYVNSWIESGKNSLGTMLPIRCI